MRLAAERATTKGLLEALVDKSPAGVYIAQDGKLCYVNPMFRTITGYSEDELLGRELLELVAPEDRELAGENAARMLEGELSSPYQFRVACKDGGTRWIMESVSSIQYRGRLATLGNHIDISQCERTGEALRHADKRYQTALELMEEGYYEQDLAGNFIFVNDAMCRLLGYSREELIGMNYRVYTPEYDVERRYVLWNKVYRTGEPVKRLLLENVSKDGIRVFVEDSVFPLRNGTGETIGFRGVAHDITKCKWDEEALRESEERYRSLVYNIDVGIFRSAPGPNGRFIEVNPAMEKMTGYSREELLSIDVAELYRNPEEREQAIKDIKSAGRIVTKEIRCRKKDGSEIIVSDITVPVRDGDGRVLYFDGILEDITESRRAEDALRQSEENHRTLFDSAVVGMLVVDAETMKVVIGNQAAARAFGFDSVEEAIGANPLDFVLPDDRERVINIITKDMLERDLRQIHEFRVMTKDGREMWISAGGAKVAHQGKPMGLISFVEVTERKKMEEALRNAAEEWRETFDSISDAISIHSRDGRLLRTNKAFAGMLHIEGGQLTGRHCYEMVHGTDAPIAACPHRETLRTGKPAVAQFFEPHLSVHLELTTSPIFDERGEITGTVHIARDVSERKRHEEHLMMADRLVSIGELAAGAAHELNNPLTSVIGFSRLIMEKDVPDEIRDDLGIICSEAQRASEVIKQLLKFARKHTPVKELNQINSIIEDVLKLRAYEQRAHNIEVERELDLALPEIMVDCFQMQQVLLNMIVNAEQSMMEARNRGTLTIATTKRNGTVVISIADDGLGISPEHMGQIFNPFFTTKKAGKGTGLGLSICHRIVNEHSGQIYARSHPGEGATFFVELPINGASP